MRDLPRNFQLDHLKAALAFVDDFSFALDIGAHKGIYTRYLLKKFKKVVAIEPTRNADFIDRRAHIIRAAAGAKAGKCSMRAGQNNTGQSHVVEGDNVKMIRIDALGINPSFIKIDVEGMEYDVLRGCKETILRHHPVVMIEENILAERYGHREGEASRMLKNWGMKRVAVLEMPPEKDKNIVFKW